MNQLNAQQLEAVQHLEGPMLVLAGPGSGKTTMITHRILHMIQERGIEERKIWVVTYTRAAAQEMRSRFCIYEGRIRRKQPSEHFTVFSGRCCETRENYGIGRFWKRESS